MTPFLNQGNQYVDIGHDNEEIDYLLPDKIKNDTVDESLA